jgi:hypothetical protein
MVVKELKLEDSQNKTESENAAFDPKINFTAKNNKSNEIAAKYYYIQQEQDKLAKEKKKNLTFRKKNKFVPKMILLNNLRNQLHNPNMYGMVTSKKKPIVKSKPVKKDIPFVYRKPDVAFKISMGNLSSTVNNISSFVSMRSNNNAVIDVSKISNDTPSTGFKVNINELLYNPKKKILK